MRRIFKASNITLNTEKKTVSNSFDPSADDIYIETQSPIDTIERAFNEKEIILLRAKSEAFRIVKAANDNAEKLLEDAKKECEKLKAQTAEDARNQGYETGYAEGVKQSAQMRSDAERIYNEAVETRNRMMKETEPQAIELISKVIKKLLNDIVEIKPQAIQNLIVQGLTDVSITGNIVVRVSKQDYEHVVENKDVILAKLESGTNVDIVKDPALSKADCIIETSFGNIDCSLDQQFESLKENLYFIYSNSVKEEEL